MDRAQQPPRPPQRRGPGFGGPGGPGAMMPGEKARDFKGSIRQLLAYLGGYRFAVFAVLALAALSTALAIFGPKVLARATDLLAEGLMAQLQGLGEIDFDGILRILLTMGGLYLASFSLSLTQGWIMSGVTNKITRRLRTDISLKLHRLPLKYFESTSQGDILSRVTNDVDTVSMSMNQSITQMISSLTQLIGVIIMMLTISPLMTLVALIVVPFSGILTMGIVKRSQPLFKAQQAVLGQVNGHTEETFGGQTVVRAFRAEDGRIDTFKDLNAKLHASAWKSQALSGLVMPAVNFIGNIGYVITCILGAYLASRGDISLGDIQAFIQYVRQFNQPLSQVANITNQMQSMAAAAERVFEFLGTDEEVAEPENPVTVETIDGALKLRYRDEDGTEVIRPFYGNIEFVDVSFGYDAGQEVIHSFSAFVQAGQKIAIVGHTGAGKTTMVKLLMRFYDVGGGQILMDGLDIRRFTRESLRGLFGMVLQDTWLYSDTIRENIRYGRLDADDEAVYRAARAARVDHFVHTLPGGYDVMIDEESGNISSGQKQLMTIARAILKDPQVLILDEATSSVDTKTEIDIQRAMGRLMEGRTSFIIAHRLSTIRDCDLILMMENGDIIEQGSHAALIQSGGAYARLWQSQFDQTA